MRMLILKWAIGLSVTSLVLMFCFWLGWLNHVGINEVGVAYNSWDGSITVQDKPGWYLTGPLTFIASFSTLPMKVSVPSNAVVINVKVVQFNPEGVQEYIRMQGFHWTLSDSELENVLMGYAFSGNDYPFMTITQESTNETVSTNPPWRRASDGGPSKSDAKTPGVATVPGN